MLQEGGSRLEVDSKIIGRLTLGGSGTNDGGGLGS